MTNRLGDVELDARGIRALAHPARLAILRRLREDGPSTATRLSPSVGASPSVTSWHLRHLAAHGLVEDAPEPGSGRSRWWRAAGAGFRFEVDPADPAPALALTDAIEAEEGDVVETWTRTVRPHLEAEWLRVAGRWSTGITVTPEELRALTDAVEALVGPYVRRGGSGAPPGARPVRFLRYAMPAAPQPP